MRTLVITKNLKEKLAKELLNDNQISRAVDLIKGIKLYGNKKFNRKQNC